MENIVRTIRVYYPVSDEALATLHMVLKSKCFLSKHLLSVQDNLIGKSTS